MKCKKESFGGGERAGVRWGASTLVEGAESQTRNEAQPIQSHGLASLA